MVVLRELSYLARWVVVKIVVRFGVLNIVRHLLFRVPQKGTLILTTTQRVLWFQAFGLGAFGGGRFSSDLLGGSWDLISKVISKVTIVISTYNPN